MKLWNLLRSHYSFALLTLIPIVPCHAAESAPTVTVHFADLNLQTTPGKAALLRRIQEAAAALCPSQEKDLASVIHHERCITDAIARTVARLHSPDFAAYYAEHVGHPASLTLSTTSGAHDALRSGTSRE